MFRRCATALLCLLFSSLFAAAALAGPPTAANSTVPPGIRLVGENGGGQPDPLGLFTVTIRDAANNPLPGCAVEIQFNNTPQMSVGSTQSYPGLSITCAPYPVVTATTDASGAARFVITGAVIDRLSGPGGCSAAVVADDGGGPVHIGDLPVAAFDLDGELGLTTNDVYLWLCDFASGTSPCRADYDFAGGVGASDLSIMFTVLAREGSRVTPATCVPFTGVPGTIDNATGGLSFTNTVCSASSNNIPITTICSATSALKFTENIISVDLSAAGVPALSEFTGAEAVVRLIDPSIPITSNLSDYWQFTAGGCHVGGLVPVAATATNCLGSSSNPLYPLDQSNTGIDIVPHPSGALNAALIHAVSVPGGQACGAMFPADNASHPVLGIRLNHKLTCTGCASPVAFVLEYVRLTTLGDPALDCCAGKPQEISLNGPGGAKRIVTLLPATSDPIIVFSDGNPVSAPESVPASEVWFGEAEPNPTAGGSRVAFRLPAAAHVSAQVLDVTGRRIATLADGDFPAGSHSLRWDGRNADGGPAPTGAYIFHARAGEYAVMRTILLRR